MIKFIYDGGTPLEYDNTSMMYRDAIHLEKVTGRRHTDFLKPFTTLDVESQGICYWFALYVADRKNAPRLSDFDFDMAKLEIQFLIPDSLEPITGDEAADAADPIPAVDPEKTTAEPTAVPT